MYQNIKNASVDIDKMAIENQEEAISYIHDQYDIAMKMFKKQGKK